MSRYVLIVFVLLAVGSCQPKRYEKAKPAKDGNMSRSYTKNGKLLSEIPMKDGMKDGVAKTFYSNGKVSFEISYKEGKREGLSKRYYESGILFQETEYRNDKKDGIQKKYWEDGKQLSEINYVNDSPCSGLKEYHTDGSRKKDYPTIKISPVDMLEQDGTFFLNLTLSNKSKRVKYYKGKLSSGGCITNDLEPVFFDSQKGIGQIRYYLGPKEFKMEEVIVIAAVETANGNTYITTSRYNLAIEN